MNLAHAVLPTWPCCIWATGMGGGRRQSDSRWPGRCLCHDRPGDVGATITARLGDAGRCSWDCWPEQPDFRFTGLPPTPFLYCWYPRDGVLGARGSLGASVYDPPGGTVRAGGQLQGAIASLTGIAGCSGRRCSRRRLRPSSVRKPTGICLVHPICFRRCCWWSRRAPRGVRPDPPEPAEGRSTAPVDEQLPVSIDGERMRIGCSASFCCPNCRCRSARATRRRLRRRNRGWIAQSPRAFRQREAIVEGRAFVEPGQPEFEHAFERQVMFCLGQGQGPRGNASARRSCGPGSQWASPRATVV